ncbi:MAG: hypothetical protein ACJ72G_03350 [Friedmanniella sp.]
MATRLLGALGLALALLLGGCTYSHEEPGLFRVRNHSPSPSEPAVVLPPPVQPGNADLPVAGETVWTTGEGAEVTIRFAVHALRRIPGATVLDWSVTPLAGPGLRRGDELPGQTNLGLSRLGEADLGIWLLDPAARHAYRSLTHLSRREYNHCLCSPLWSVEPELRVGETRLLQVAFPPLPDGLGFVDVYLANLPPVVHLPVTAIGQVPTTRRRVDLTRPPDPPAAETQPVVFKHPGPQSSRISSITIDRVVASPGGTAVQWTLRTLTDQYEYRLQPLGPPISARRPSQVELASLNPANGPTLRSVGGAGPSLATLWMTTRASEREAYECLCSEIGLWARARNGSGGTVHLVGLYPALPAGTRTVEVALPGLATVRAPVTAASDAARRLGPPVNRTGRTWIYSGDVPPQGWPTSDWPSPLPDEWQLPDYRTAVEDIVTLPPS